MIKNGGIILSPGCTNDCFFCGISQKSKGVREENKESINQDSPDFKRQKIAVMKNIIEFYKSGVKNIEISGCDPIDYDDIIPLIKYLKSFNFEDIILATHGKRLHDEEFANRLINSGLTKIRIPLYGHNAEIHDSVTLTKKSFDKTLQGIKNLLHHESNIEIVITTLLCRQNKDDIIDLINLLNLLGIKKLLISIPNIPNQDFSDYLPIKDLGPIVTKIYDYCKEIDFNVGFSKIPYCVIGRYDESFNNRESPPNLGESCQPHEQYKSGTKDMPWYRLKKKVDICKTCSCYNVCDGFNTIDFAEFGAGNLKPVKKKISHGQLDLSRSFKKDSGLLLCIPPCYETTVPPLGTPILKAYLASKNIFADQIDLNLEFTEFTADNSANVFWDNNKDREDKNKDQKDSSKDKNDSNKRTEPVLNKLDYKNTREASNAFIEEKLSSDDLLDFLGDQKNNIFHSFFREDVLPRIIKYDIFGFSVTSMSQVLATLTLAMMIKQEKPAARIIIGGQWVSFFREAIMDLPLLFEIIDYAILFDGEEPLCMLLEAIEDGSSVSNIPNLMYKADDDKSIILNKERYEADLNELSCPDFDGLFLNRYKAAKEKNIVHLTYETARGCYWNKCCFCDDLPLPKSTYRERKVSKVINDIKSLQKRYDVKSLVISNATFSPKQLNEFSIQLIDNGISIEWGTMLRFEKELNKEILLLAKQAGCFYLNFGLESACQRILNHCEKGIKLETAKQIMADAKEIDLKLGIQIILGLPSETISEALETIKFLLDYPESDPIFSIFYLIPNTKVFNEPDKYGIIYDKDLARPFRYSHEYKHVSGEVDRAIAREIIDFYWDCRRKNIYPKNILDSFNKFRKQDE